MGADKKDEKKKKPLIPLWPKPEMDPIDEKQEVVIQELWDRVIRKPSEEAGPPPAFYANLPLEDQRILMYKFCVARKFKVDDAEKMVRSTIAFKTENKCWESNYFPCVFQLRGYDQDDLNKFFGYEPRTASFLDVIDKKFNKCYQATFHKWDKLGHPLMIERTGDIAVKPLVSGMKKLAGIGEHPSVPCLKFHTYFNEVGVRLAEYNDKKLGPTVNDGTGTEVGRRVLSVLCVMDCKGLGYGHVYNPALDILKKVWACDADYYPEGLHRMVMVNCPSMTEFIYGIVKGWLDPRVREKVCMLSPDKTAAGLLEMIDPENLPEYLGGTCTCEGGCVFRPDEADSTEAESDELLTEEINIKAGKNETREFVLAAGDEVTWEFEIMKQNVEFSVNFVTDEEAAGGEAGKAILEKTKSNLGTSNYVAEGAGRLVMVWDNGYSWLNSKTLRLRLAKISATTATGDETKQNDGPETAGGGGEEKSEE